MVVDNVLHMNSGDGKNSYAQNSTLQEKVIAKVRTTLENTIRSHYKNTAFPKCFAIADFGCSSGPNTFLAISQVMGVVVGLCRENGQILLPPDEFQVFLNDLSGNDFNTIFDSLLPTFYENLKRKKELVGKCFISGVPGSFYSRLFPCKSLHFAHSSYSLHWLSQVPKGIENNKGNLSLAKTSPGNVCKAYMHQFRNDFTKFLCCRGEELIPGGQMILTLMGRSSPNPTSQDCWYLWELLSKTLLDMATEGLVQEADIDSFNAPIYKPYIGEVRDIIEKERSFILDKLETFEVNWDPNDDSDNDKGVDLGFDKKNSGQNVANWMRAITEPMLATHFGDKVGLMDDLFVRYAKHVADHLAMEKTKHLNIVISLTKL